MAHSVTFILQTLELTDGSEEESCVQLLTYLARMLGWGTTVSAFYTLSDLTFTMRLEDRHC